MIHDAPSPGPWYTDHEHEHVMVFGADKIAVADCAPYYASPYQAVCEANARLIVAAPDLLEALKVFAVHFGPLEDNEMLHPEARRCFALARAAIAKAEGTA